MLAKLLSYFAQYGYWVVFFGVMIAQSAGLLFHNDYEMLPVLGGIVGAQWGMYVYLRGHNK